MEFVLLVGLVFGIIVYRRRADGGRVDVGLMARRLFEFGFLFGLSRSVARNSQQTSTDFLLDLLGNGRILTQVITGVLFALANLVTLVGVPGTGLVNQALLYTQIQHFA